MTFVSAIISKVLPVSPYRSNNFCGVFQIKLVHAAYGNFRFEVRGNAEETGAGRGAEEGLISIVKNRLYSRKKKNIPMLKSSEKL